MKKLIKSSISLLVYQFTSLPVYQFTSLPVYQFTLIINSSEVIFVLFFSIIIIIEMSRPVNSINKSGVVQSSSILQVITTQGPSTVTIAGGAATLNLDSLFVKNIYLLDTLHAKLSVDTNAPDKLIITKGSITNQVISDDPLNEVISFNNVRFEPDLNFSNIVSIYADYALKLGKLGKEVDIISSNINFFSDKTLFIHTDSNIYGNLAVSNNVVIGGNLILDGLNANEILAKANINGGGNITIKDNLFVGGNVININTLYNPANVQINFTSVETIGTIEFQPGPNIFNFNNDTNIQGNLKVAGNLIIINEIINSNVTIFQNSNIIGNLTVENNLLVYDETRFLGNLIVNQNANIYGNITVNKDANIYGNITANNVIIYNELILNKNILLGNTNLKYNSNTVLSVDSSNIINMSNIIIVDNTNLLDVLLEVRGNITCNNLYLTSNVDKKKNIREISSDEIERLNTIKSYNFDLKLNDNNNYGFLAHEIKEIYPILSNGDSVNYIGFIPLLLEKIKILENKIKIIEEIISLSVNFH